MLLSLWGLQISVWREEEEGTTITKRSRDVFAETEFLIAYYSREDVTRVSAREAEVPCRGSRFVDVDWSRVDVIRRLAARRVASALGNALQRHAYNYSTAPLRSPSTQVLTALTTDIRTASLVNVTFLYTSHLFHRLCSTLVWIIVMYIPIPCRPADISASLFLKS